MKKYFLTIFLTAGVSFAHAQTFDFPLISSNQQLIEEAVSDGFFILHRSYQLKDSKKSNPEYYNWGDANYFGETFTLGIKTLDGYLIDDAAVHPWLYDAKFDEYRENSKYEPVISESEYKGLNDKSFAEFPNVDAKPQLVGDGQFYSVTDSVFGGNGFQIDKTGGVKKGWIVWVTASDSLLNNIELLIIRSEQEFTGGKITYPVKSPVTDKHVVGGIFVKPEVSAIGHVVFRLSGLMSSLDGQWQIIRILQSAEDKTVKKTEAKKGLTPAKKQKK